MIKPYIPAEASDYNKLIELALDKKVINEEQYQQLKVRDMSDLINLLNGIESDLSQRIIKRVGVDTFMKLKTPIILNLNDDASNYQLALTLIDLCHSWSTLEANYESTKV